MTLPQTNERSKFETHHIPIKLRKGHHPRAHLPIPHLRVVPQTVADSFLDQTQANPTKKNLLQSGSSLCANLDEDSLPTSRSASATAV